MQTSNIKRNMIKNANIKRKCSFEVGVLDEMNGLVWICKLVRGPQEENDEKVGRAREMIKNAREYAKRIKKC